jgi:dihydrofolate reductase
LQYQINNNKNRSNMRKVILFMHVSLDGFVCGPNGELDWATMTDDAMGRYLASDLLTTVDTMLVGRKLFEGFASYWPSAANDPANPKELVDFAHWMEDTPKIVFSKSQSTIGWKNAVLAKGTPAEEVARLKQQPGGDMVIFGGAEIIAEFTRQNLVDEYRLKLEPVVLGKGKRLFEDVNERMKLKLVKEKSFESGVVGLYYEVIRK